MVLMGINRIVVTDGKIQAKIMYDFQARDNTRRQRSAAAMDYARDQSGNVQSTYGSEGDYDNKYEGGETQGKEGTDYYETYDIDNQVGQDERHGTFVAPSTGIHGWFWENKTGKAVTLKVISAGFYDWIFLNRDNKETAVKTMDPAEMPGHPKIPDEALH